jgi:hypothetical protein
VRPPGIRGMQEARSKQLQSVSDTMETILEQVAAAADVLGDTAGVRSSLLATNMQRAQMAIEEAKWAKFLVASAADAVASNDGDSAVHASKEATLEYWGCLKRRNVEQKVYFVLGSDASQFSGRRLQQAIKRQRVQPAVAQSRDGVSMRTRSLFDRYLGHVCCIWVVNFIVVEAAYLLKHDSS